MNVVDSSAWLEYFANGPNAPFFARPIEATDELVVPSLTIYEVFKRVLQSVLRIVTANPHWTCTAPPWVPVVLSENVESTMDPARIAIAPPLSVARFSENVLPSTATDTENPSIAPPRPLSAVLFVNVLLGDPGDQRDRLARLADARRRLTDRPRAVERSGSSMLLESTPVAGGGGNVTLARVS